VETVDTNQHHRHQMTARWRNPNNASITKLPTQQWSHNVPTSDSSSAGPDKHRQNKISSQSTCDCSISWG
jgi:hypothetical protein